MRVAISGVEEGRDPVVAPRGELETYLAHPVYLMLPSFHQPLFPSASLFPFTPAYDLVTDSGIFPVGVSASPILQALPARSPSLKNLSRLLLQHRLSGSPALLQLPCTGPSLGFSLGPSLLAGQLYKAWEGGRHSFTHLCS